MALCEAGLAGGRAITACCLNGRPKADTKTDGSPVTLADLNSDYAVRAVLSVSFPGIAVISEETAVTEAPGDVFILVDPLDGTREFVAHGDNWCIAVALIISGRAIAGAIVAPRLNRAWYGGAQAYACAIDVHGQMTASREEIHVRQRGLSGPVLLGSRFHNEERTERIVAQLNPAEIVPSSSAIKFGLIAEGRADLYVRCGATMEWDVAAGDAILRAAGGAVCDLNGAELFYGAMARNFLNPPFVAAGDAALAQETCIIAQRES